jgi:hypothetical protein
MKTIGLLTIIMLLIASAAMAAVPPTNTVTYPGVRVGFDTTVWNGSGWVGQSSTLDSLTIDANVAIVGSYHLSNNAIHFNLEDLTVPTTGTLTGDFWTNDPGFFYMYIAGVPAGCDMSVMKNGSATMPVTWSGSNNFAYNAGDKAVESSTFPIGPTTFTLNCTVTPGVAQAPGTYVLDPTIEIKSIL